MTENTETKKTPTINIVVVQDNVVESLRSFTDPKQAEQAFIKECQLCDGYFRKLSQEEVDNILMDGCYQYQHAGGEGSVNLVHST